MSKVSEFHPTLFFSLPVSEEPQQLILVLQIELFVLTFLPALSLASFLTGLQTIEVFFFFSSIVYFCLIVKISDFFIYL